MPKTFPEWLPRVFEWLGKYELTTLLLVAVFAAGIWGFVALTDEVLERETRPIDLTVLLAMRNPDDLTDPIGPRWFEEVMRDLTALGGMTLLTLLTLGTLGLLALQRKARTLYFLAAAVYGGWGLTFLLKAVIARPRPDLVPHGSHVYSASFPSGHTMMSAVTYLTLAALVARVQPRKRIKAYLLLMAILLTVATGVSRVYLGVHWPTDVLAGWAVGGGWAAFCGLVARWLQRRGQIDPEPKPRGAP